MISIYKYTNLWNGKCYVGSTKDIKNRDHGHKQRSKKEISKFYNAVRKYGWESFQYDVIEECCPLVRDQREKFHIDRLGTMGSGGYNSSDPITHTHSEETKKKISEANSGEKNGMFGKKASDDTRKKLSESRYGEKNVMFGKKHSSESIDKMSRSHTGINHTDETKKKMSETRKGKPSSMIGKKQSEETRKKMSEAQKKRWAAIRESKNV